MLWPIFDFFEYYFSLFFFRAGPGGAGPNDLLFSLVFYSDAGVSWPYSGGSPHQLPHLPHLITTPTTPTTPIIVWEVTQWNIPDPNLSGNP